MHVMSADEASRVYSGLVFINSVLRSSLSLSNLYRVISVINLSVTELQK